MLISWRADVHLISVTYTPFTLALIEGRFASHSSVIGGVLSALTEGFDLIVRLWLECSSGALSRADVCLQKEKLPKVS